MKVGTGHLCQQEATDRGEARERHDGKTPPAVELSAVFDSGQDSPLAQIQKVDTRVHVTMERTVRPDREPSQRCGHAPPRISRAGFQLLT
jgi:hypothetical protein